MVQGQTSQVKYLSPKFSVGGPEKVTCCALEPDLANSIPFQPERASIAKQASAKDISGQSTYASRAPTFGSNPIVGRYGNQDATRL